jgi:hypothetical protein
MILGFNPIPKPKPLSYKLNDLWGLIVRASKLKSHYIYLSKGKLIKVHLISHELIDYLYKHTNGTDKSIIDKLWIVSELYDNYFNVDDINLEAYERFKNKGFRGIGIDMKNNRYFLGKGKPIEWSKNK